MLSNIRRNIMGTTSFDAKFPGMRKPQDFIVYPLHKESTQIRIQSDKRWAEIDLTTGLVKLSVKGKTSWDMAIYGSTSFTLSSEDLLLLKSHIFASASGKAGTNGVVYTDNSGALGVFGG